MLNYLRYLKKIRNIIPYNLSKKFNKILNLKNQILWPLICFIFPFFIFISTDIIRQFTSLIFILISLAYFQNSKFYRSIIFLVIASFFHISSLIFFGFLLFLLGFSPLYTINPFPNSNNKKYII